MSLSLSLLESFELFDRDFLCQTTIFKVNDMVRSSSTHLFSSHIDDTSERLTSVFSVWDGQEQEPFTDLMEAASTTTVDRRRS